MKKVLLAGLAIAGLAASPASAQRMSDVSEQEMAATVRYALPLLVNAAKTKCASTLQRDGFFATQGDALAARYRVGAAQQWPVAKRVLLKLAAEENPESRDLLAALPDDSLRPFIDGILPGFVAAEIKPESCATIERAMELMAPLPADNVAALGAFAFSEFSKEEASSSKASGATPRSRR